MRLTFLARHVHWLLLAVVSVFPAAAQAQRTQKIGNNAIQVDCNRKQGPNRTIQGTLNSLGPLESHTLVVSGTCNENILIQGFERLTLIAKPGASINDASGGTNDVVAIFDASRVSIQGFTINGGADGVVCQEASLCQFSGNTFQNAGNGANIFRAQRNSQETSFRAMAMASSSSQRRMSGESGSPSRAIRTAVHTLVSEVLCTSSLAV